MDQEMKPIEKQSITEILSQTNLLSMATIKDGKEAWINTVCFSFTDDFNLYFLTYPTAQHSQNIIKNNSVAITVFDTHQEPKKRGLQIFGICQKVEGLELAKAINNYAARFPWLPKYIKKPEDFAKTVLTSRFYVTRPKTIKIFDEKLFGEETWVTVNIE
ncbi:pyridoxamine 5'-phosphate oxidase family protein [Candidatus Microgenomates bacterium]|nr:pyridoxamine 5'-phosphate oxidase family protein [Candidatus Microgenomates bacterium]